MVPCDIPSLVSAYFLSELGSVIDVQQLHIVHTNVCVAQKMQKRSTGHVAVSIVKFGQAFPNSISCDFWPEPSLEF